jgi:hypothetical protein
MSKRASGFARHENDFYPTPAKAVLPLIPHLRADRERPAPPAMLRLAPTPPLN